MLVHESDMGGCQPMLKGKAHKKQVQIEARTVAPTCAGHPHPRQPRMLSIYCWLDRKPVHGRDRVGLLIQDLPIPAEP